MDEVAIEDRDEWRPFCGTLYPQERVAGDPMICTRSPHILTEMHLNQDTGFTWWGDSPE
jgi:hypothetical protein